MPRAGSKLGVSGCADCIDTFLQAVDFGGHHEILARGRAAPGGGSRFSLLHFNQDNFERLITYVFRQMFACGGPLRLASFHANFLRFAVRQVEFDLPIGEKHGNCIGMFGGGIDKASEPRKSS